MNTSTPTPAASPLPAAPFPSIVEVQDGHDALLRRLDTLTDNPSAGDALWGDVASAVEKVRITGAWLEVVRDRRLAQSVLDFWSSALHRAGREAPPARLDDFDPNLAPALPDEPCPYQGLAAFREDDSGFFFGRDTLLRNALDRLDRGDRFLAVVGESGSGKSSFVLAGLLPLLKAGRVPALVDCRVITMVPGSKPLANLAQALPAAIPTGVQPSLDIASRILFAEPGLSRDSLHLLTLLNETGGTPAVIVVDQFEEVFTLCQNAGEREAFVRQLLEVARAPGPRHVVILTMRTDYLDQVARIEMLPEAFRTGRVDVDALSLNELRAAIEMPAAKVGLRFAEGIVDDLISKVLGERAGLPLLQFTLRRLWERRQRNRITRGVYADVGDPREALGRAADAFYERLIPQDQETARQILLRMVRPGEGREVTSNRIPRAEVFRAGEASDRVERVLGRLIGEGLVKETQGATPADTQIEVAHEALIRNWTLLMDWLEAERALLRQRRLLTDRARAWKEGRASLLRGQELRDAEALKDLSPEEGELLDASKAGEAREEAARKEAERQQILAEAEQRRARQARRAALGLAGLSAVALGAAIFGFAKAREATRSREEAVRSLGLAETNAWKAEQNLNRAELETRRARMNSAAIIAQTEVAKEHPDRSLALLAGLEAVREGRALDPRVSAVAYSALAVAVDRSPRFLRRLNHSTNVLCAAYSPDGHFIVTGSNDNNARIWEAETGRELSRLEGHADSVWSAAYSPDGDFIVTGSGDKDRTARIWEAETGREVRRLEGHEGEVYSAAYSPDGDFIVTGSGDYTARIWEAETGREVRRLEGHESAVYSAAYSPDGDFIVTGSGDRDKTARIWEAETGRELRRLEGHEGEVYSAAYSPDGDFIVTGSGDYTARIWEAETGREVRRLEGHESAVYSAAYSPDGDFIVTGSGDYTARIWEAETGRELRRLEGHAHRVWSAAYSPDRRFIVTGSWDNTARIWEAETGREVRRLEGHAFRSAAYSPDRRFIVTGSEDNTARIWEAETGREVRRLEGHAEPVLSAAYSPDGRFIVTGSEDHTARIWEAENGREVRRLEGHEDPVASAAYSPDGRFIVTGSWDHTARIWEAENGREVRRLEGHGDWVFSAAYSPDGHFIVTGSRDSTGRIWEAETGREVRRLEGNAEPVSSAAYSPDGDFIVTTGSLLDTARIWEAETGREVRRLEGHGAWVNSAAYSPDGHFIVTGSADYTARIWEAETGRELRPLEGHADWVLFAAYSPDGHFIVTGSADNTVRIWAAGVDVLIELARQRIQREPPEFTPEERERFGLPPP